MKNLWTASVLVALFAICAVIAILGIYWSIRGHAYIGACVFGTFLGVEVIMGGTIGYQTYKAAQERRTALCSEKGSIKAASEL